MKIRGKLVLSFGGVMVLVICALGIITYLTFSDSIRANKEQIARLSLDNAENRLAAALERFQNEIEVLSRRVHQYDASTPVAELAVTLAAQQRRWPHFLELGIYDPRDDSLISSSGDSTLRGELSDVVGQLNGRTMFADDERILILVPFHLAHQHGRELYLVGFVNNAALQEQLAAAIGPSGNVMAASIGRREIFNTAPASGFDPEELTEPGRGEGHRLRLHRDFYVVSREFARLGWRLHYAVPRGLYLEELISLKNRSIAATIVVLWIAIWVVLIIAHRISRPIRRLSRATHDIQTFDYSTPLDFKTGGGDEISDLAVSFEKMRIKIKSMISIDPLTETFNRRHMMHALESEIAKATRNRQHLSCLMIDLDFFKRVNDSYGHQCGDMVLARTAGVIRHSLRSYDLLARFGGEEFMALLPNTDEEGAVLVAERVRASVEAQRLEWEGREVRVTLSIGASSLHFDASESGNRLIRSADEALYRAKAGGRNKTLTAAA